MEPFVKDLINTVALPVALVIAGLVYVVIPIANRHIKFVDEAIAHMGKIAEAMFKIQERLDRIDANTKGGK